MRIARFRLFFSAYSLCEISVYTSLVQTAVSHNQTGGEAGAVIACVHMLLAVHVAPACDGS